MLSVKNILSPSLKIATPAYDCFEAFFCHKEKSSKSIRQVVVENRLIFVVDDLIFGTLVASKLLPTLNNRFKVVSTVSTLVGARIGLTLAGAGWIALRANALKFFL